MMHHVNTFRPGAQLQAIKMGKSVDGGWCLSLDFYPEPRKLFVNVDFDGALILAAGASWSTGLSAAAHPLQLYLRAHFQNARLKLAEGIAPNSLVLDFAEAGRIILTPARAALQVTCEVPGRTPFSKIIRLAKPHAEPDSPNEPKFGTPATAVTATAVTARAPALSPEQRRDAKRRERLLQNVRADSEAARAWLSTLGELCRLLETNPQLWAEPARLPEPLRAAAQAALVEDKSCPFGTAYLGRAQTLLFTERRRQLRKLSKAAERLEQVERDLRPSTKVRARKVARLNPRARPSSEKPKPGLWVLLTPADEPEVWARVGRRATENDELFRQARDRDLWFHAHGATGAHVWIARGQPGLGNKDAPSEQILKWGCQLALYNSAAAKSGSATIDCTERRQLRKIRGVPGKVEVLRSQTRFVRSDPAFERRILGK